MCRAICVTRGKVGSRACSRACVFLLLMSRDFTFPRKAYCNVFNEQSRYKITPQSPPVRQFLTVRPVFR